MVLHRVKRTACGASAPSYFTGARNVQRRLPDRGVRAECTKSRDD